MKSTRYITLSVLFVMISLMMGYSQSKKNSGYHPAPQSPKYSDPKEKEKEKAKEEPKWGYGVNLGNIYFTTYTFQFGLQPNIAYKLTESLAAGFMLKLDYFYEKDPYSGLNYSAFDYGPTLFIREKPLWTVEGATPFLKGIFVQAEYERAFVSRAKTDEFGNIIVNGNHIETVNIGEDYVLLGLGVTSGYPFSTFFSIHYNIIDSPELSRIPWTYRLGFTYNY